VIERDYQDRPVSETHELPEFLALLTSHAVSAVADVRSQPTSWQSHFDRAQLPAALRDAGIEYVFLGQDLGARRSEPECYDDGRADYERIAGLPAFQKGLARIRNGLDKHRICLLCAEKEPLDCHRTILVCRHLREPGIQIQHILADGTLEDHAATERRLLKLTDVQPTLFEPDLTEADLIEQAYEIRGREIAFRVPAEGAAP
jgi:uncharacterized protein (DUF488 family)